MKKTIVTSLIVFLMQGCVVVNLYAQSALQQLTATMHPGDWAQLTNVGGLTGSPAPGGPALLNETDGAAGNILPYNSKMCFDPILKRAYFLGTDHVTDVGDIHRRFIYWDDADNTWHLIAEDVTTILPKYAGGVQHGWSWNTCNLKGTRFYRGYGDGTILAWDIVNNVKVGESIPENVSGSFRYGEAGTEYFPELNKVLWANAPTNQQGFSLWDPITNMWSSLPSTGDLNIGGAQAQLKYNPVWGGIWFTGGEGLFGAEVVNGHEVVYPNGRIQRLKDAPFNTFDHYYTKCVPDPVNGEILCLHSNFSTDGDFYKYNLAANAWTHLSPPPEGVWSMDPGGGTSRAAYLSVFPVSTYGVTVWVNGVKQSMWVYKNATSTTPTSPTISVSTGN